MRAEEEVVRMLASSTFVPCRCMAHYSTARSAPGTLMRSQAGTTRYCASSQIVRSRKSSEDSLADCMKINIYCDDLGEEGRGNPLTHKNVTPEKEKRRCRGPPGNSHESPGSGFVFRKWLSRPWRQRQPGRPRKLRRRACQPWEPRAQPSWNSRWSCCSSTSSRLHTSRHL